MTTVNKWSNVVVEIESAHATALTLGSISKASEGVVGYTGTDPTNGDYVRLAVSGMRKLDGRLIRVKSVDAQNNTFVLEGENTTSYDTFSAGTAEVVTLGLSMSTVAGLTAAGGNFSMLDITTIHDDIRKQMPGIAEAITYTFDSIWDASDSALVALKAASDSQELLAVRFGFNGGAGAKVAFNGYIGCTMIPVGTAQDKVMTSIVIAMKGRPTVYAS